MMQYYFPEYSYLPILSSLILNLFFFLIAYFILFKWRFFSFLSDTPPVTTFLTSSAAFLSLMVAFFTASVWQNASSADHSAMSERIALKNMRSLPLRSAEFTKEVNTLLDSYLMLVKTTEWGLNYNISRDEKVDVVLKQLASKAWAQRELIAYDSINSQDHPSEAVVEELILNIEELELAREQRLSLGKLQDGAYWGRWVILYLLAFLFYLATGAVHIKNPRTARFTMLVVCFAVTLAFSMTILYLQPYKGPGARKPSLIDTKEANATN